MTYVLINYVSNDVGFIDLEFGGEGVGTQGRSSQFIISLRLSVIVLLRSP